MIQTEELNIKVLITPFTRLTLSTRDGALPIVDFECEITDDDDEEMAPVVIDDGTENT